MRRLLLLLAMVIIETGCTVDLFNSDCRNVGVSGYWLCRDDNGGTAFYLEPVGKPPSAGGVLDGVVQTIGWNEKVIVASRYATFRGDHDGLMVVNLAARTVEGPFDPGAIASRFPNIKQRSASEVWSASSRW